MRRGGISPMAELLGGRLRDGDFARKIGEHSAPLVWAEVVGETIAAATQVLSVDHGILRVSAKSGAWAQELTFLRGELLARLNRRLGAPPANPFVREIHFVNRGVAASPSRDESIAVDLETIEISDSDENAVESLVSNIDDPTLRDRVRQARRRDIRLRTWRIEHGWAPCARCGDPVPPVPDNDVRDCPRCRLRT